MSDNNNKSGRRPALGDVTNQIANKPFPLSKPLLSLSGHKRSLDNNNKDTDSHLVSKCPRVGPKEARLSPLRGGKTYRLKSASAAITLTRDVVDVDVDVDVKETHASALDSIDLGEHQHLPNVSTQTQPGVSGQSAGASFQVLATRVLGDNANGNGNGNGKASMTSSPSESIGTSRFNQSQETPSFGLDRCTFLNLKAHSSNAALQNLLNNCSCSFCTKAGYIWSDLQCQDVKGRISTLAKRQKEASKLAQRYSKETETSDAQGKPSVAPRLETDLTTLWKSLFAHMDDIYTAESDQLQSNLAVFKDLKEDYKMNLEMINLTPPEMQQSSSDASEL